MFRYHLEYGQHLGTLNYPVNPIFQRNLIAAYFADMRSSQQHDAELWPQLMMLRHHMFRRCQEVPCKALCTARRVRKGQPEAQ